jgi:hypothetical protein
MKYLDAPREPSQVPDVTRRRVLTAGGITFVAAFITGCRSSTSVAVPASGVAASPRAASLGSNYVRLAPALGEWCRW